MITPTIRMRSAEGKVQRVYGTLAFSGNYVALGDAFPSLMIGGQKPPLAVNLYGASGTYDYFLDAVNNKIIIKTDATGAEVAAGAYPAPVIADAVTFEIAYPKFG